MSQRAVIRVVDGKGPKLVAAAGAAAAVGFVAVALLAPGAPAGNASSKSLPIVIASSSPTVASNDPTGSASENGETNAFIVASDEARAAGLRTYALPVSELAGLPPDAEPGTELELWVAWDPPVTKEPRVQRLLRRVLLQAVLAPPSRELPAVALIAIRARDTAELIYGDRYGTLSVTLPTS